MKKRIYLIPIIIIFILVLYVLFSDFPPMLNKGHGTLIADIPSPDKKYNLQLYKGTGGATVAEWITADIKDNYRGKVYTLYYCYRQGRADAKWVNIDTVEINGIILDIHTMRYNSSWRQ